MVHLTADGRTRFRVFAPEAERVELLGCFTGWHDNPIRMMKSREGWHEAECELDGGDYEFQYLVDGATWLADYAAGGVKMNVFGNWVSQLHVPARTSRRVRAPRVVERTIHVNASNASRNQAGKLSA